ncbi:MAG: phosphoribosyltransferase [Syntrophales bacterium]|jgi:hypothetical protein|nr:phosphoribosyltransferase [Syntrophales bacterium]
MAEPDQQKRSKFAKATEGFWEHDIIEAVFSDCACSIQETYIKSWQKTDPKKIPRIAGTRVDGPDGDYHILRTILEENRSSLNEEERHEHGLPLVATGLHSIRRSIEGSNFAFAVRSGISYVLCTPQTEEKDSDNDVGKIKVRRGNRLPDITPGVHYIFRIASLADRPLIDWIDGIPEKGIEHDSRWWTNIYPDRFSRVHFVDTYLIPDIAITKDVIVCRAHHGCPKHELIDFINKGMQKEVNIILAEMPAPIALRMYRLLQLLSEAKIQLCIPIITNNMRVQVAGDVTSTNASKNFALKSKLHKRYWWNDPSSPIQNLRELFLCSREYDSRVIWEKIKEIKGAFIEEPVKWSRRWVLTGGFLSFNAIYRSRAIRKIFRRRMVLHAQALRAKSILPSTDALRHLATVIQSQSYLDEKGPTVIIDAISATGLIRNIAFSMLLENEKAVFLPAFNYPQSQIEDKQGKNKKQQGIALRLFDWLPLERYNVEWDIEGKPLNVRLWRKGNSAEVAAMPKDRIVYVNKQGPKDAYAIWQRDELINIGHFSYGTHHWFVGANLKRFVVERSSDSREMFKEMLDTIERWKPSWIFFVSHETTEALIQSLWREAEQGKQQVITEDNSWSLGDIAGFSALMTPDSKDELIGNKIAIILDDATVTGKTILSGKHKLRKLGFKVIHSMVIIDRQDPDIFLKSTFADREEHFSWWGLFVPEIGTARSCKICQGIRILQKISGSTDSGTVKDTLMSWLMTWKNSDNLQRYEKAIPRFEYNEPLKKRLGDLKIRNIKIYFSEAACVWSLEISKRLEWYSFLAEDDTHKLGDALTESMAGVLLHYWDNLNDTHKRALTVKLIDRMWNDYRVNARSLVAVCLSSLSERELETVLKLLYRNVAEKGIASIDVAVFIYAVLCIVMMDKSNRIEWLRSLQELLKKQKENLRAEEYRRTISFLQAIETTQLSEIKGWDVLLSFGLPGRSSDHENIFSVFYRLKKIEKPAVQQRADIYLLKIFLEPIERCLNQQKAMFEGVGLSDALEASIRNFKSFCKDKSKVLDRDSLITVIDDLNTVLNIGSKDYPSARTAINAEYLHYLPYVVREQIKIAERKGSMGSYNLSEEDFLFEGPSLLVNEKELMDRSNIPPPKLALLLTSLHSETVVMSAMLPLTSAIRDCLFDVKHPKKRGLGLDGRNTPPYMKISFKTESISTRFDGHQAMGIIFENRAEKDQIEDAAGTSWHTIQDSMQKADAIAESELVEGVVTRKLWFRAFGKRNRR